jgi:hypothetical protein
VQVGLFGKPVAWDLDQLVYKELTATGSNASTPPSWQRAIELMRTGKVKTAPLITHVFPVTEWGARLCRLRGSRRRQDDLYTGGVNRRARGDRTRIKRMKTDQHVPVMASAAHQI